MSVKSNFNSSNVPLQDGKMFIGKWDSVLDYSTAIVTVNSDVNTKLILYQSPDKVISTSQTFFPSGGVLYTKFLNLTSPFFYLTLQNVGGTNATELQLETIYRTVSVSSGSGGGVGGSTNIFDSSGNNINASSGNLQVEVTNFPTPLEVQGTVNIGSGTVTVDNQPGFQFQGTDLLTITNFQPANLSSDNLKVSIQEQAAPLETTSLTRVSNTVFAGSISAGSTSLVLNLSSYNTQNISVFGNVAGTAVTLTLQYSADNSLFFNSQYSITVTNDDFGFTIPFAASYARLKRTDAGAACAITAILQAC